MEVLFLVCLHMEEGIFAKRKVREKKGRSISPYGLKMVLFSSSANWDSLAFSLIRVSVLADNLNNVEFPITKTFLLYHTIKVGGGGKN